MIKTPSNPFARPTFSVLSSAGLFFAAFAVVILAISSSVAQAPKAAHPGAAPRVVLPPRPAPRQAPTPAPKAAPTGQTVNHVAPAQPVEVRPVVAPPTVAQRPLPQASAAPVPLGNANHAAQNQLHIGQWIEAHRHLPLAEQQRALENEPGFRSLRTQEQQQLHQRLTQLNNMPAADRAKVIGRTEAMESLAPVQRQQVRNAMAQLGSIPEERRHVVSRQFFQLRDMLPAQRQAFIESAQYRSEFNEPERTAIGSLLNVAPIYSPLQAQATQPR